MRLPLVLVVGSLLLACIVTATPDESSWTELEEVDSFAESDEPTLAQLAHAEHRRPAATFQASDIGHLHTTVVHYSAAHAELQQLLQLADSVQWAWCSWCKKLGNKIINKVTQVFNSAKDKAASVVDKLKNTVKGWANKLKSAAKMLKILLKVAKKFLGIFECVRKEASGKLSHLLRNPSGFAKDFGQQMQKLFPEILKTTKKSVRRSLHTMDAVFGKGKIDARALFKDVVQDVKSLGKLDPATQCLVPMIDMAASKLGAAKSKMALIETDLGSPQQKVIDWIIRVPWKQVLKPRLLDMFDMALEKGLKAATENEAFKSVRGRVLAVLDKLKKNGLVTKLLQKFSEATGEEKDEYARKLKAILSGKISFEMLAKEAVAEITGAVLAPLLAWVEKNLPQWFDYGVDTVAGGLLKATSFVGEEVLAEPVPLSQWGMEAIGSGVMETLKAGFTVVKQTGRELMMEAVRWIIKGLVSTIFKLPMLGATAVGAKLDQVMRSGLKAWNAQIEKWVGATKDFLDMIPADVKAEIAQLGKRVYNKVMDEVAPELKTHLDYAAAMLTAINGRQKEASLVLVEVPSTAQLAASLKGALVQVRYSPSTPHPHFLEYLQQSNPDWISRFDRPTAHWEERESSDTFLEVLHSAQQSLVGKSSEPTLTVRQMYALEDITQTLPTQLSELQQEIHGQLASQELDKNQSQKLAEIAAHLSKAHSLMTSARGEFAQVGTFQRLLAFLKARWKDFQCLLQAGSKNGDSMLNMLRGSPSKIISSIGKHFENMLSKLFQAVGRAFKRILKHIADNSMNPEKMLEPAAFEKMFEEGLNDFEKVEPATRCIRPLAMKGVQTLSKYTAPLVSHVKKFADTYIVGQGEEVFAYLFEQSVNMLGGALGIDVPKLKNNAVAAVEMFLSKANAKITQLLTAVNKMKPGSNREALIRLMKDGLNGELKLADAVPVIFNVVRDQILELLTAKVEELLPKVWDKVLDMVGVVVLPALAVGENVLVASGSVASEWVASGINNLIQQIWSYLQTAGRGAFVGAVKRLVEAVLNVVFDKLFTFVVKPLVESVLKPVDKAAGAFTTALNKMAKKIAAIIPAPVLKILMAIGKSALESTLKLAGIGPKLKQQMAMNRALAAAMGISGDSGANVASAKTHQNNRVARVQGSTQRGTHSKIRKLAW